LIRDLKNIPVEKQRLIYAGKQLGNDTTFSSHNLQTGNKLHLALELIGGMGKKGCKKLLKAEKLASMRAASQYKATLVDPAVVALVVTPIATTVHCIKMQIEALDIDRLRELKTAFDDLEAVRESSVVEALLPTLFPPAAAIDVRIATMQQEMVVLTGQKDAIAAAVTTCFADEFYKDAGSQYDYKALFDSVTARIEDLEVQRSRDQAAQIAQQQAQLAQQQAQLAQQQAQPAGPYNVFTGQYAAPDADMDP
jgi:hypothetical protein